MVWTSAEKDSEPTSGEVLRLEADDWLWLCLQKKNSPGNHTTALKTSHLHLQEIQNKKNKKNKQMTNIRIFDHEQQKAK